jgi:hypothetical protein
VQWVRRVHSHNRYRSDASVRQYATSDQVRQWPACHAPIWARFDLARDSCWQGAHHYAAAACSLDTTIVRLEPCTHSLADVPRGIVPPHQQRSFPFSSQPFRQPPKKLYRHCTDRTTVHKAEEPCPVCPLVTPHNMPQPGALGRDGRARVGSSTAAWRLSRYGGRAGRGDSTRPHPESLRPSGGAPAPAPSGGRAIFFRA